MIDLSTRWHTHTHTPVSQYFILTVKGKERHHSDVITTKLSSGEERNKWWRVFCNDDLFTGAGELRNHSDVFLTWVKVQSNEADRSGCMVVTATY